MGMSAGRRIAKEKMLCMFCNRLPCECNKREELVRVAKKAAPIKTAPVKVEPEARPAPAPSENEDWAAIRVLYSAGMLHPKEVEKWRDTALLGLTPSSNSQQTTRQPSIEHRSSLVPLLTDSPNTHPVESSTVTRLTQWKERRRATWR